MDAKQRGELTEAAHSFKLAEQAAKTDPDRVKALFELARIGLQQWSGNLDDGAEAFSDLDFAYQTIRDIGTPEQQLQAANNLGSIYAKTEQYDAAVGFFSDADDLAPKVEDAVSPILLARFYTNYGRALRDSGSAELALYQYLSALEYDPNQSSTRDEAISTLQADDAIPIDLAVTLGSLLLEGNDKSFARAFILQQLATRKDDPRSQELLSVLVRYYAVVRITPPEFADSEWPDLNSISSTGGVLQLPTKQLYAAFFNQPEKITESALEKVLKAPYFWRKSQFSAWTREPFDLDFATLLNSIAEYYASQNQFEYAFVRFSVVWELDPGNSEAGLAAARIFVDIKAPPATEGRRFYSRMTEFLADPWFDDNGVFISAKEQTTYDDLDLWNMYWMYSALTKSDALGVPLDIAQWEVARRVLTIDAKNNRVENTEGERRSDRHALLAELLREQGNSNAAYKQTAAAAEHNSYTSKGFTDTDVLSLLINPNQPDLLRKMKQAVEKAQDLAKSENRARRDIS